MSLQEEISQLRSELKALKWRHISLIRYVTKMNQKLNKLVKNTSASSTAPLSIAGGANVIEGTCLSLCPPSRQCRLSQSHKPVEEFTDLIVDQSRNSSDISFPLRRRLRGVKSTNCAEREEPESRSRLEKHCEIRIYDLDALAQSKKRRRDSGDTASEKSEEGGPRYSKSRRSNPKASYAAIKTVRKKRKRLKILPSKAELNRIMREMENEQVEF